MWLARLSPAFSSSAPESIAKRSISRTTRRKSLASTAFQSTSKVATMADNSTGPARCRGEISPRPALTLKRVFACRRARRIYLILGDSHAAHIWRALSEEVRPANLMQASASGCRPLLGLQVQGRRRCTALMSYIFDTFLPGNKVDGVVLAARWKEAGAGRRCQDAAVYPTIHVEYRRDQARCPNTR